MDKAKNSQRTRTIACCSFICVLYVSYCVFAIISVFQLYNQITSSKFGVILFLPIIVTTVIVLTMYILTFVTDPGYMPKQSNRSCQSAECLKQKTYDNIDMSVQLNQQISIQTLPISQQISAIQTKKIKIKPGQNHSHDHKPIAVPQQELEGGCIVQEQKQPIVEPVPLLQHCKFCRISRYPTIEHCSNCRRCAVLLDHHCPFNGTCIGIAYMSALFARNKWGINYFKVNFPTAIILQLWSAIWALLGIIFAAIMVASQRQLQKGDKTTRIQIRKAQSIQLSIIDIMSKFTSLSREQYVQNVLKTNPLLQKLYPKMKKFKNPYQRRFKFGKYMPKISEMQPQKALTVAWCWIVVLNCVEEEVYDPKKSKNNILLV